MVGWSATDWSMIGRSMVGWSVTGWMDSMDPIGSTDSIGSVDSIGSMTSIQSVQSIQPIQSTQSVQLQKRSHSGEMAKKVGEESSKSRCHGFVRDWSPRGAGGVRARQSPGAGQQKFKRNLEKS